MTRELTDDDLKRMWDKHAMNVGGIFDFIREVIEADRALRAPMTEAQAIDIAQLETWGPDAIAMEARLIRVIRAAERFHKIKGDE